MNYILRRLALPVESMFRVVHQGAVFHADFVHRSSLQEPVCYLPFSTDHNQNRTVFSQKCGIFLVTL